MVLKDNDDQLVLLAERLPQLVWFTGPDGYHDYFNRRWYNLTGMTAEQCRGDGWKSAVHPEDRPHVDVRWRQALQDGAQYEAQYRLRRADGAYCWMLSRGLAHRDPDGRITRWFGTCTNIDAQKRAEDALAQLEEQHRLALQAARLGTWSIDLATNTAVFDAATCGLMQIPPDRAKGMDLEDIIALIHADDREAMRKGIAAATDARADGYYQLEYRIPLPDGEVRWIRARGKAYFVGEGADRRAVRLSGVLNDNTRQHALEEGQHLLTRELNHRVKNLFAIANGMVSLTARGAKDPKEMATALRGRLGALSRAHELVQPPSSEKDRKGGDIALGQLIEAVLAPFKETHGDGIVLEGPDIRVGSNTTTALALVFHELATNALKHGCLSEPEGRLSVRWAQEDDMAALEWTETHGPPIEEAPTFEGFGSQLTQRSITGQLGGTLEREWRREGLCVHMAFPLDRLAN
ncbi:sensor histidine kinase [Microvirga rosea]|uniref:sensor histidine kinase n=1 Tax=Microvirga rosea TaxID=2715425 RepID=UPI001D0A6A02|nr:PAS domain-containing protein [Microvirga rosea]MCB8822279.1 PAS domain-containing protein [Microvirga rosea]